MRPRQRARPRSVWALVTLLSPLWHCSLFHQDAPAHDAATADRPRDATAVATRRRRRNRNGRVVAQNTPNANGHAPVGGPAGSEALDPVDGIDDGPDESAAPRVRPRITETGPMLPEDLGPPPDVHYDLGAGQNGPMGLEPAQISRGMNPLMGRLSVCADATTDDNGHGPHGHVTVRLRIHNDGHPMAARVSGGGGPPEFITCARRVVASARFDHFSGPDVMATWGFDVDH